MLQRFEEVKPAFFYSSSASVIMCYCQLFTPHTPRLPSLLLVLTSHVCSSNLIISLRDKNIHSDVKAQSSCTFKWGYINLFCEKKESKCSVHREYLAL